MFLHNRFNDGVYSILLSKLELELILSFVEDGAMSNRDIVLQKQLEDILDKIEKEK